MSKKKYFVLLWILCIIGQWALIPYLSFIGLIPPSASRSFLLFVNTVEVPFLWGLICFLSYQLSRKVFLHPFATTPFLQRILFPGILSGVGLGFLLFVLEKLFHSPLARMHPPAWAGILASLYGGINEEVSMRLFLLTLVYFLLNKIDKIRKLPERFSMWPAIVVVALIFGLGHLFYALKLAPLSSLEIVRIFLLNGIPGIVYGWLYFKKGFWAAALSHFTTDLMIHVYFI